MDSANVKLKVAVVGLGIGIEHIKAYQASSNEFEIMAVCDINLAKAQQTAATYGVPLAFTKLADVCAVEEIDVIDLCTPPYLHFEQIQESLQADKYVICEKPLVGSLKHIDELMNNEIESGKRIMPIFQSRFGLGLQKLKYLADEGLAGRAYLATVETAWRRREKYYEVDWRGKWESELGGVLSTHAIHAHDVLYYILGEAKSVFARAKTLVNSVEVEDCAVISLEMMDGSLASLSATLGSAKEITRHRFCFSNLSAESGLQPYGNTAEPWMFIADTPEIAGQIEAALKDFDALPEGFEGQFQRFSSAITKGKDLPVSLKDARASLELLTAAYYSAEVGELVNLPIEKGHPRYEGWLKVGGL